MGAAGAASLADRADAAGLPKSKITRVRYVRTPTAAAGRPNTRQPLFNQSQLRFRNGKGSSRTNDFRFQKVGSRTVYILDKLLHPSAVLVDGGIFPT